MNAPGAAIVSPASRAGACLLRVAAITAALLAAGCADLSGISPIAQPAAPASVGLAPVAQADFDWPAERWWQRFGDARLHELVERALAGNPTLMIAEARLARSTSFVEYVEASAGPRVDASTSVIRQRFTENGLVSAPLAGRTRSVHTAMLDFAWELDFFGRNRAALQAALGAGRAAQAEVQAARVLLTAQVVRNWVELARLQTQRRLAAEALEENLQLVALVASRVRAGLDSRMELRRAEGEVPRTRATLEAIDGEIALARNALAVLSAQAPDALAGLEAALPDAGAAQAPAQLPADLLGRRADIAAARWRIEAAIGARDETAARFRPNVNLSAFVGLSSLWLSRWVDGGSLTGGAGPALRLPIFDSGRLRAELRERTAGIDEAVQTYNAAIAEAAREVADHLASLRALSRHERQQREALAASEDAHALALQRYRNGLATYLEVRSAQLGVIAERRVVADLAARGAQLHAGLARALGGGYEAPEIRTDETSR